MATLFLAMIYSAFVSLGLPDSLLGAAWPETVSYTHLDVYKRQVPAFAVLYSLTSDILARRLAEKGIDAEGRPVKKGPTPPEAEE